MGFFELLFGKKGSSSGASFRSVDWLEVESKIRQLEAMASSKDQATMKQLIIQSDVLVDSIMKQAGVAGQTMGDRLKSVGPRIARPVLNKLWHAHKKRNELVHEPGSFVAEWEKEQYFTAFKDMIAAMRGLR